MGNISEEEDLSEIKTNICVQGELFQQCSFLLINIPIKEISSFESIKSIDEAEKRLDTSLEEGSESFKFEIPPETEFCGHCSNLQVWVENNYDIRLIHRNLAFPLLKRLTEVGDPSAKGVFREEIAKRFTTCYLPVIHVLLFEGYLDYLSEEELETIFNEVKLKNRLLLEFLEPTLRIKGYSKHDLSKKGFIKYLNKFYLDLEEGKFLPLSVSESFDIDHSNVLQNWLLENI